jgi:cytochrome c oxidase subunit 2
MPQEIPGILGLKTAQFGFLSFAKPIFGAMKKALLNSFFMNSLDLSGLFQPRRFTALAGLLTLFMAVFAEPALAQAAPTEGFGDGPKLIIALIALVWVVLAGLKTFSASMKTKGVRLFNWNKVNAVLMVVFLVVFLLFVLWHFLKLMKFTLPVSASAHGVELDGMLSVTFWITIAVFVLTQILLFGFALAYRHRESRKALFYADNHQLEFYWTVVPAIVLTVLVLYGTKVWREITQVKPAEDALQFELFAYQFGWQARYPGADGKLGGHDFRLISATNSMGIEESDSAGRDDLLVPEITLPVNRPVLMKLRARDVIHSAYMPHFRVQMNVVPGMPTQFYFTPTVTTKEMREITGNSNFVYELACNKICGAAHFNMRLKVNVVSDQEYADWLTKQRYYFRRPEPAQEGNPAPAADTVANLTAQANGRLTALLTTQR